MRVQLNKATVMRDGRRILEDVTLTLEPGTVTAVAGAAGSGRTTLLDLAAGLTPTEGEVRFDGVDVRDLDGDEIASSVAVVTRTPFVLSAPIRENLALGASYGEMELGKALRLAGIDEGPDTMAGAGLPAALRQRIGLARAILRRPRLLVLDDATTALDEPAERHVLERLGVTVLVTTDRPAALAIADQVVRLEAGRVVNGAPPAYAVAR